MITAARGVNRLHSRILRSDAGLINVVTALSGVSPRALADAWGEFTLGKLHPRHVGARDLAFPRFFLSWWIHGGAVRSGDEGARTPALEFLSTIDTPADDFGPRLAATIAAAPFGFHRIADVEPGRSMTLENVLTGECRTVLERESSTPDRLGESLYARVATFEGVTCAFGSVPWTFETSLFPLLERLRNLLLARTGRPLVESDLHDLAREIRFFYMDFVAWRWHAVRRERPRDPADTPLR